MKFLSQLLSKLIFPKILILTILFFLSCSSDTDKSVLASYKDDILTLDEVLFNKPSSIDSSIFVSKYINNWLRNKVRLNKAQLYIEYDKELQLQVDSYKERLIINRYHNELLNHQFDTTVLKSNIEKYYKENKQDFVLNKDIVKAKLVVVNKESIKLNMIQKLIVSKDKLQANQLSDFCELYAENSFLNDSVWVYFSEFLNKLPISKKEIKKISFKKKKLYSFTCCHKNAQQK